MRKHILTIICLTLVLIGCSKSGSGPSYLDPEPSVGSDGSSPPSVDERLAWEAGLKDIVYHVGPVDLPKGLEPEVMLERPLTMRFQVDEPLWVVGFKPKVVDKNGTELPSELLHLAIVSNMHEDNPLCSDAGSGNPFVAATSMLTSINLPRGYGYPILQSDPLEAMVVLKNDSDESYIDVFFELTLIARPMGEFTKLRDVKPMLVELDPCDHETVSVAPGKFVEHSATYQMPSDANLIVAHGVIEDFGSSVELVARGAPSPFWRAEAELDENHRIKELIGDPFSESEGVGFKEGDELTLSVAYDNFSESWLTGATAAAMVYLSSKD